MEEKFEISIKLNFQGYHTIIPFHRSRTAEASKSFFCRRTQSHVRLIKKCRYSKVPAKRQSNQFFSDFAYLQEYVKFFISSFFSNSASSTGPGRVPKSALDPKLH